MTRGQTAAVLTLAAGAGVLAAALVWISQTTLRLETAEREARRLAAQEEKARLALWRLDSTLTAVIGSENARPAEQFLAVPTVHTTAEPDAFADRRFQVDPQKPSVLPVALLAAALEQTPAISRPAQAATIPPPHIVSTPPPQQVASVPTQKIEAAPPARPVQSEPAPVSQEAGELQTQLNANEFIKRAENASQQNAFVPRVETQPEPPPPPAPPPHVPPTPLPERERGAPAQEEQRVPDVRAAAPSPARGGRVEARAGEGRGGGGGEGRVETTFQPAWVDGQLYLVRRVHEKGRARLQVLRIDWPALRSNLLGGVRDLLPGADLLPVLPGEAADPGRRLALLPLRLAPGPLAAPAIPAWTPARLTLAAGSGAIALAGLAVGALLLGSLRQSQRRADFVSAVTHELRTPLTTVRMYTEMLAGGMVPAEDQDGYLATLHGEAERLGHLVENVLAYSRLERHSQGARLETIEIGSLLGGMAERLQARAARDGFTLVIHPPGETAVDADLAAVERILLNWVDNGCKYAAGASDRRLEIETLPHGRYLILRLRDHGPGIPRAVRRRLFRPFHKSAAHAAASAPGVGLGLSLSRRLARSLGGDLRVAEASEGAAFELVLRRTSPP